ncbi:Ig-like domain-containing protein [Frondihabitans cladoniiphilus]
MPFLARTARHRRRPSLLRAAALAVAGVLAVGAFAAVTPSAPARAATITPIQCTAGAGLLVSSNGSASMLSRVVITSGGATTTPVGQLNDVVNAIGWYSPDGTNGYLYGINDQGHYVRFGENAGAGEQDLGVSTDSSGATVSLTYQNGVSMVPAPAGVMTDDGYHLAINQVAQANGYYRIVKTYLGGAGPLTSTYIPLSGVLLPANPVDFSFNPYDGLLYSYIGGSVYSIDADTGVTALVPTTTAPGTTAINAKAGGSWTDSLGNLYFYENLSPGTDILKLDPKTDMLTRVAASSQFSQFDATACLPPSLGKTVSPSSATTGGALTFTFSLANPTAHAEAGASFVDTLPAGSGLTWDASSIAPPAGSTVAISGSTLTVTGISIPKASDGLLQFTAGVKVTGAFTPKGYTNTASLTAGGTTVASDDPTLPGSTDPTPFTLYLNPAAQPDTATTPQGVAVTTAVAANDSGNGAVDATTVRLVDGTGALVTSRTIAGQGTYTVGSDGTVAFAPVPTFTGTATSVAYSIADSSGHRSTSTLVVTVTPAPAPSGVPDTASTAWNTAVGITPTSNDDAGSTAARFDPTSVRLTDPVSSAAVTSVTVAGHGSYAVDTTTGVVTFTPVPAFSGSATPVGYTASTTFGTAVSSTITVSVGAPAAPTATDDTGFAPFAHPLTLTPLANDDAGPNGAVFDSTSLRLLDSAGTSRSTVSVAGEGVWTVGGSGSVVFTPAAGFSGAATPLRYTATTNGGATVTGRMTPTIGAAPTAAPKAVLVPAGRTATLALLAGDAAGSRATIDAGSVVVVDSAGASHTTLTISSVGSWTVGATGSVAFVPVTGYAGTTTVGYRFADSDGNTASSTASVTVATPPVAVADSAVIRSGETATVSPSANDSRSGTGAAFVSSTLHLVDPTTGAAVDTVTVDGQGTWSVGSAGAVTFVSSESFSGSATPVRYTVQDRDGESTGAPMSVTVNAIPAAAAPDTKTAKPGQTVTIDPLANDSSGLVRTTLRLVNRATKTLVTTLTVPDEGTYVVDTTTGLVAFTPATGFTGTSTVTYSASNASGVAVESTIVVSVAAASTIAPARSGDPALAFTGSRGVGPMMLVALLAVGAGVGLRLRLGLRRRRGTAGRHRSVN